MTEKLSTIYQRIDKVLIDNGLIKPNGRPNYAKAERICGIKGTVLSKTIQRKGTLSDANKEKFLRTFHVKPTWFDTGKGPEYITKDGQKLTPVGNSTDSNPYTGEASFGNTTQIIRTLMELEKDGEYRFVPKKIFDDYDLFPKHAIERQSKERDKTIEALERYISGLEREIDDLRSGRMTMITPAKQT